MKFFTALLYVLFSAVCLGQGREKGESVYGYDETAAASDILLKTKYDKFKDLTSVYLRHPLELNIDMGDLNALSLNLVYTCSGDSLCRPDKVLLSFEATASTWRYIKTDRQLILMLDGERFPLGSAEWDGDASGKYTSESLYFDVETETVERILKAKFIEGQLGHRTFKIREQHLLALKTHFQFPPAPPKPAEPAATPKKIKPKTVKKPPVKNQAMCFRDRSCIMSL